MWPCVPADIAARHYMLFKVKGKAGCGAGTKGLGANEEESIFQRLAALNCRRNVGRRAGSVGALNYFSRALARCLRFYPSVILCCGVFLAAGVQWLLQSSAFRLSGD